MKITGLTETIRYLNSVHEKRDTGDNGQQSGQNRQENPKHQKKDEPEVHEVSDQNVGAAIQAFQRDQQARANGLQAEMNGKGPGLRVVLKDGSGAIVRQFTGEEFLQMQEAAKQGQSRGRILDRKI